MYLLPIIIPFYFIPMIVTFVLLFQMNKHQIGSPTTLGTAIGMSCVPFLNLIIALMCLHSTINACLEDSKTWNNLNN